ncbi:Kinase, CAMK CAMKL [Giardia muris]|uniref:non-specific serine/threonine protein kinase n=1 Tax=Giardia muris TaxID=5742 RepID=A0A4Z1SSP0_GIAMU|nr:Kinase, CAMK CAMKL [Giardia muris]|eukprot:TNJ28005.1 Kinase, CAMK CAMKL [Giardia muris]
MSVESAKSPSSTTATPEPEGKKIRVKRVGNYIIGKSIGEGSFSKVRIGTHIPTGERIALKIIEKGKITEAADVERITREIQILKLLNHPYVIRLYEIVDTPRHVYIVQEYMGNGELFDYIVARGHLSEVEACRFLCQMLSALNFLHSRRIVHRDLKPENVLLTKNNDIKIIDFGLSNIFHGSYMKTCCGSPAYAPPEMIEGQLYSGPAADLWSTGVILYAMLCGCLPFESSTTQGLYRKILSGEFSIPDQLSQGARDVLRSLLTVDPKKRITIKELVNHPWIIRNWALTTNGAQIPILTDVPEISSDLNFAVLLQMKRMGLDPVECIRGLFQGKHNAATATYTLLAEKVEVSLRERGPGTAVTEIIPLHGYEKKDFSTREVKKEACAELGLVLDDDSNILFTENGKSLVIGHLTIHSQSPSRIESPRADKQEKVAVRVGDGVIHVRPETAALMATVPDLPVKKPKQFKASTQGDSAQAHGTEDPNGELSRDHPKADLFPARGPVTTRDRETEKLIDRSNTCAPKEAPELTVEYDETELRIYKDESLPGTTCTLAPEELFKRIEDTLTNLQIRFVKDRVGVYRFNRVNISVSLEVCRVGSAISPTLCIVTRRLNGDGWMYKEVCTQILNQLDLDA